MSESMIERVAKAIAKARGGWHADEGQWRSCEDEARAAIQAMADPTEAMKAVGCELLPWGDDHGSPFPDLDLEWRMDFLLPLWTAMIDEALK